MFTPATPVSDGSTAEGPGRSRGAAQTGARGDLYTPEQRRRRDASPWTIVQGVLAPIQVLICLASLGLIIRALLTGRGLAVAETSVVVKTLALYTIMITGSLWEREVYGCYLFAPAFYWEDVVSMLVLALHTAYLAALATGALGPYPLLLLALAAYASYAVNATQFVMKLRAARLGRLTAVADGAMAGAAR